jgi:hypothetical protein
MEDVTLVGLVESALLVKLAEKMGEVDDIAKDLEPIAIRIELMALRLIQEGDLPMATTVLAAEILTLEAQDHILEELGTREVLDHTLEEPEAREVLQNQADLTEADLSLQAVAVLVHLEPDQVHLRVSPNPVVHQEVADPKKTINHES